MDVNPSLVTTNNEWKCLMPTPSRVPGGTSNGAPSHGHRNLVPGDMQCLDSGVNSGHDILREINADWVAYFSPGTTRCGNHFVQQSCRHCHRPCIGQCMAFGSILSIILSAE